MRAVLFDGPGRPLRVAEVERPRPGAGELLVRVIACGICRTDLHVLDGELTQPKLPLVMGHQVVGEVTEAGTGVAADRIGTIVGIPWLGGTCGGCGDCRSGRENLCREARFTGYQRDGGFAEYCVADADYCFLLPPGYEPVQAAPLLCAGLIGYRSLRMAGEGARVGIYGFGAAAHILMQVLRYQGREGFAFTREGDRVAQEFALSLGASWAGASGERPPEPLDAAILFAPVGALVPLALRAVRPGGRVVCGGIHMSDIPSFPYELLWEERSITSVANLTRADAEEFLPLAGQAGVKTEVTEYPLERVGEALADLKGGRLVGAGVVRVGKRY